VSCVARVKNALESLPWVEEAVVDFANKKATVKLKEGGHDASELCAAVEGAGYGCSVLN